MITGTNRIHLNLETVKAILQEHINAHLLREALVVSNVEFRKEQYGSETIVVTVEAIPKELKVSPEAEEDLRLAIESDNGRIQAVYAVNGQPQ